MANAFTGLGQGLDARRAVTIGKLFAASFPNFEATAALYKPGQEVVGEGDPTENFFLVVRGLFRAVKYTRDGRRQVFAFYMPGDMCGLEPDATHKLTVEAVNKAAMAILPRHACRMRMNDDPQFNAALFERATRALTLSVDHMTILGRNSAEERLAWFLIMLQGRSTLPELCPAVVELAMERQDIADYLGLSIETISRTFTLFRERGLINLSTTRRVEIVWPAALARLAAADRDAAAVSSSATARMAH
jgi:CRP/FNR family transcriptional regulator, nitrogen fixation regulation protein